MKNKSFFERAYTVMEIRTGFATGLPVLSGGLFGAQSSWTLETNSTSLNVCHWILSKYRGKCFK